VKEKEESRKILIAGTGKSGIAAARLVLRLGGSVLLYNSDENTDREAVLKEVGRPRRHSTAEMICGKLGEDALKDIQLAVLSPGIPLDKDFVKLLDRKKIPVIGEMELAYQASRGMLLAITGTNGKTTTTALTGEILKNYYEDVHVGGNIGLPFSTEADKTTEKSVSVVEVSSFMLETIYDFHPHISAILNITPDHLDRHKTMENYIRCKEAITLNQTEEDFVVLNYDDEVLRKFGQSEKLKPQAVWFSSAAEPAGDGLFLKDSYIYLKDKGTVTAVVDVHDLQLLGTHNYENVMAAAAMGIKAGVPLTKIVESLKKFKAVEHRIEFVRERAGVKYYNDSKGTNTDAAIKALLSMPGPVLLIGGGYDKHAEFDDWVKLFPGRVKKLVLIGETRDQIEACCKKHGYREISFADDMEEAVRVCASYADEGDYVLLSPACASFDMFKGYEERGQIFKKYVNEL